MSSVVVLCAFGLVAHAPKRSGGQVAEGDREATRKRPRDKCESVAGCAKCGTMTRTATDSKMSPSS